MRAIYNFNHEVNLTGFDCWPIGGRHRLSLAEADDLRKDLTAALMIADCHRRRIIDTERLNKIERARQLRALAEALEHEAAL